MFGDILGKSAGETCTDPVDRFRPFLAGSCGVLRALDPEDPGSRRGLWLAETVPGILVTGEGGGKKVTPLAELEPGRDSWGKSLGVRRDCVEGASGALDRASGSSRDSMLSVTAGS